MKFERNTVAGVAMAASTLGTVMGIYGMTHDWSPSEHLQQQVDACAPHLPEAAMPSPVLPTECRPFTDELLQDYGYEYDLPGRKDFIAEYSPGTLYDTRMYLVVALLGSSGAAGVGVGTWVVGNSLQERRQRQQQRESRFAGSVTLRRRVMKNSDGYFDGLPLDCYVNASELKRREEHLELRRLTEN